MHSEGTIKENDQIIYTRVGPDQIPNYQNQYVTIVGKVISEQNQDKITLDIGKGWNVVVENIGLDPEFNAKYHLEVRGQVINDHLVKAESWNPFQDANFDLEMFVKMLEHYHSNEYSSLTLN